MRIKKLRAVFGGLDGAELELSPGLNVIQAPNEAGKSTWCAFVKAMLYGVSTSDRSTASALADKKKYLPWNGSAMEGSMDIICDGKEITLTRTALGAAPMKKFSAVYTGTAEPVQWLTGETAGEALVGVPEKIFARSAFIGQRNMKIDQTADLERRIAAIVSTGDEDTSYTEADEKLRSWLRKRRYNKSGILPKLQEELRESELKLQSLQEKNRQAADLRIEVERLTKLKNQLTDDLEVLDKLEYRDRQKRVIDTGKELRRLRKRFEALTEELTINGAIPSRDDTQAAAEALSAVKAAKSDLQNRTGELKAAQQRQKSAHEALDNSAFPGMTPEEAEAQVKATQEALDAVNKPKSSPIPSIILGAVGLVLLIMGIAMKLPPLIYAAICPVLGGAGWLTFAYIQDKRDAAVRGEILSRCKAESSGELLSVASGYAVIYHEAQSADEAVAAAEAALKQAEAEAGPAAASLSAALSKLTDQSPDQETAQELITHLNRQLDEYSMVTFQLESTERIYASLTQDFNANMSAEADVPEMGLLVRPVRNKKETQELLSKTQAQLELASTKYSMAQGTINAMGDPVVLSAERNMLQEQYNTAKTEYDALALAIETLSDANSEIQTRFAPMLSGKASEIMARLTDGKYRKLGFSRTLESEAEPFGSTVSRSSLYLSQGTADQLYLALRLAICDLVLPDGAECPLILDDALVNFDDKRAKNALELLRELSETRQVVILTCQSREAEYFSSDSDVSIIKLGDGN